MTSLKRTLMRRDSLTSDEADDLIKEAQDYLQELLAEDNQLDALDICETMFGLEPDFLMDLL